MNASPSCEWECRACKANNAAHAERCMTCRLVPHVSAAPLAQIQGPMTPVGGTVVDTVLILLSVPAICGWYAMADGPVLSFLGPKLVLFGALVAVLLPCLLIRKLYRMLVKPGPGQ
jgi:hypothetical protein